MYEKGRKQGSVKFTLKAGRVAKNGAVAGSFNGWRPVKMRKQNDGSFAVALDLPPGRHEYKFIVDGQWLHDTDVAAAVMNQFGSFNSVAVIE